MAKVRELCGIIYSQYDTEADFARDLGWSRQKLNRYTTGAREPDLRDAAQMANKLGIKVEDIAQIFLAHQSPNEQQPRG